VTRTLVEHEYGRQPREAKGVLRQYLGKMTGLSRAQVTRLIGRYHESGMVQERGYRRYRFVRRYTPADIGLLAGVDEVHETLSGRRRRRFSTASSTTMVTSAIRDCHRYRYRTSTTCVRAGCTASGKSTTRRRSRCR